MIIAGEKGGGSKSRAPIIAPDDLRNRQTLKIVGLISEGPIAGVTQVYIDNNPIENIPNATYELRLGTSAQTPIPGFDGVTNEFTLGLLLDDENPIIRTVSGPDIDSIVVTFGVDAISNQSVNGDLNGHSISFLFEVRDSATDPFIPVLTDTIKGKSATSSYRRSVRLRIDVDPPPSAWQFRITRTTPNANNTRISDTTRLFSYKEVNEINLSYPNVAVIGYFLPSEVIGGRAPKRSLDVDGRTLKVPNNYDPIAKTSTGMWGGVFDPVDQFTTNPAWILYDLVTNTRYGAGIPQSKVDHFSFQEAAEYCDELVDDGNGGTQPRYEFNATLTIRYKAFKAIQLVASICRALVLDLGGKVRILQDRPDSVSDILTNNDVAHGKFTYMGSALTVRHNSITVAYNEPSANFIQETVTASSDADIATHGYNPKSVSLIGCTSRGQAMRHARWELETELKTTEVVSFKIGTNKLNAGLFSILEIQDEHYANKILNAKVVSSTGTTITLDKDIDLDAEAYNVKYYGPDGETLYDVPITDTNVTTGTLSGTFTNVPLAGSSLFLWHTSLKPRPFRIISILDAEDGTFDVSAVAYDAGKYDAVENGYTLPADVYSQINLSVQLPVQNLSVTEEQYHDDDSVSRQRLRIDWTEPTDGNAIEYGIDYRRNDGEFTHVIGVDQTSYLIDSSVPGVYDIHVFAANVAGTISSDTVIGYTLDSLSPSGLNSVINFKVQGGVSDTEFDTKDVGLIWQNPVSNEGIPGATTKDFVLEVWDSTGSNLKATYVILKTVFVFIYTYEMNREDFGGTAVRNLQFRMYVRDVALRSSTANILSVTNPSPAAPSLAISDGYNFYALQIVTAGEPDIIGYQIYADATTGFTPGQGNLIYDGPSDVYQNGIAASANIFFKVAAYDNFGKSLGELNLSSEYTTTGKGLTDSDSAEYRYEGFDFSPDTATNTLSWSAGTGRRVDAGSEATWSIVTGSVVWTAADVFIYNVPQSTALLTTETLSIAVSGDGRILGTYKGGNDLSLGNGDAYLDGGKLIAQTVGASQLVTSTAIITDEAQMALAVINEAAIQDAVITDAKIQGTIQSTNYSDATKVGWKLDKSGKIVGQGIEIYDPNGDLAFGSGGLDFAAVVGATKPDDNADATDYDDVRVTNSSSEGSLLTLRRVVGGQFSSSISSHNGAIKITLPQYFTNTMLSFNVVVYNYVNNATFTLEISGYNATSGWTRTSASITGTTLADNAVRFGHDGTTACVWIGEVTTIWRYPKIAIRDFQAGHSNFAISQWDDNWTISIVVAFNTVQVTHSDALIDAKSIQNQGNFATLDKITSSNASTYIANAAIRQAQIASASIGAAQIINATIGTLKIAGNAVTVTSTAYTSSITSSIGASYVSAQSVSHNAGGGVPVIHWAVSVEIVGNIPWSGNFAVFVQIRRSGTQIYEGGHWVNIVAKDVNAREQIISGVISDSAQASSKTYEIMIKRSSNTAGSTWGASHRSIAVHTGKR